MIENKYMRFRVKHNNLLVWWGITCAAEALVRLKVRSEASLAPWSPFMPLFPLRELSAGRLPPTVQTRNFYSLTISQTPAKHALPVNERKVDNCTLQTKNQMKERNKASLLLFSFSLFKRTCITEPFGLVQTAEIFTFAHKCNISLILILTAIHHSKFMAHISLVMKAMEITWFSCNLISRSHIDQKRYFINKIRCSLIKHRAEWQPTTDWKTQQL